MPTMAAAKPEAAPRPNAQRGPNLSATQPTIGAPIGVQPMAIARRIAMTRPRMAGSVDRCIRLFVEFVKGTGDRSDRHDRRQEPVLSGSRMKHSDGHG